MESLYPHARVRAPPRRPPNFRCAINFEGSCKRRQHYAMLQRNLLYTGVTRGKRLVVLVGQKKAVAIAVRNVLGRRRWSKLGEWLRPSPPISWRGRRGELSHGGN